MSEKDVEEVKIADVIEPEEDNSKNAPAITGFVFAIVAAVLMFNSYQLLAVIFSIVSLSILGKAKDVKKNPYLVFYSIAKPLAIIILILSVLSWIISNGP